MISAAHHSTSQLSTTSRVSSLSAIPFLPFASHLDRRFRLFLDSPLSGLDSAATLPASLWPAFYFLFVGFLTLSFRVPNYLYLGRGELLNLTNQRPSVHYLGAALTGQAGAFCLAYRPPRFFPPFPGSSAGGASPVTIADDRHYRRRAELPVSPIPLVTLSAG